MASKKFTLTQSTVEAATCRPGKKDVLLFDEELHGFGLRVTKHGGKTFLVQYRFNGKPKRVVLGAFGALTPAEARKKAKVYLGAAADGRDVAAEQAAKAAAAKVAADDDAFTFGIMVAAWAKARAGDRRPSYLAEAVKCCTRNLPEWKDRPASSITVKDAIRKLDAIKAEKGTVSANRTQAYARAAFSWAQKRQAVAANPLRGMERPGREVSRDRVLTEAELRAIWRGAGGLSPVTGGYIRTLLLTMQRREEVARMQWSELADGLASWTVPAARAKNGRATIVHLSEPAREIIRAMPRIEGNPFVFAGRKDNEPIRGFNSAKANLDKAIAAAGDTLAPWSFHDFRRSGVTLLAGLGYAPHVCDRILNHITGSIQGVAAVYQRHEFLSERKAALDAWAELITKADQAGQNAPAQADMPVAA